MPNFTPNAKRWHKCAIVLHDFDHKSAPMLMVVTVATADDGIVSTRYLSSADGRGRRVMRNHYSMLHDPALFNVEVPAQYQKGGDDGESR